MAGRKFKLDAELTKRVAELESDIRAAAEEFRSLWDDASERWQEGDAGTAADAWIETLYELGDALEGLTEEPEEPE